METKHLSRAIGIAGMAALLVWIGTGWAPGQMGAGGMAPPGAMDTLNQGPVGPGGAGARALNQARGAAGPAQQLPGGAAAQPGTSPFGQAMQQFRTIKVISGTRVFDAVTGELLDDADEIEIPETEKENYFDDGTHGDVQAEDGKFTRVTERSDVIGWMHQRFKEALIEKIQMAERMDPLEFYGLTLLSTERYEPEPRKLAWQLVPNSDGGPGMTLAERPTEAPIRVPKQREMIQRKNEKLIGPEGQEGGWAYDFLERYRIDKGELRSEFYSPYVPLPPRPPESQPPAGFNPFPNPSPSGPSGGGGGGAGGIGGEFGGGRGSGPAAGRGDDEKYIEDEDDD